MTKQCCLTKVVQRNVGISEQNFAGVAASAWNARCSVPSEVQGKNWAGPNVRRGWRESCGGVTEAMKDEQITPIARAELM
jgi:hypothetical protein